MILTQRNCMTEWHFSSGRPYSDPFNDVTLDVVVTDADGVERRVPAFWSGESTWRVRYSSAGLGRHTWRSDCSDASNPDLHGREGVIEVVPYEGNDPLMRHGPLRVSESGRHLEHLRRRQSPTAPTPRAFRERYDSYMSPERCPNGARGRGEWRSRGSSPTSTIARCCSIP